MALTSYDNYFEDFCPGDVYQHARARTVTNQDNLWMTHMSLNTSQAHFNLDYVQTMMGGRFQERLFMGAATLAIVVGLTSEDMAENAFLDLGFTGIRLPNPVYKEDTLYASSVVLTVADSDSRPDAGLMTYRFTGRKNNDAIVVEGERQLLIKRRGFWGQRDGHGTGGG